MARKIETREGLLEILPKGSIGIEIGVFKAKFSETILAKVKPKLLYLLDTWEGIVGSGDKDGKNKEYVDLTKYFTETIIPKYRNNNNVVLIRNKSSIISTLKTEFDWCYIDAEHSYEGVKQDLNNIYPKIKRGGYVCGHDYCERTKGVIKAVDEFCKEKDLQIDYLTNDTCSSYAIRKK
jgi:hypothetical protein